MKKIFLIALAALSAGPAVMAQSAVDALQLNQTQLRGTARFMGMGGAFTALGGDLSTLTQNPAGIGVYRHSEIGATMDINIMKATTTGANKYSDTKTKVACNNFGYVGVANLNSDVMPIFSWGVTYNRIAQFDRKLSGYTPQWNGSLTNYIAAYTSIAGFSADDLNFGENYNPYQNPDLDPLSILAFNSYLINPRNGSNNTYNGLYGNGTTADSQIDVREKGYVDEYSINFGGNISDVFYWGLGIGITDMSYTRWTTYSESMSGAYAYSSPQNAVAGGQDAGYYLDNYKKMTGSGWKMSFGVIFKPVNELRIGAAIHTPTYWSVDEDYVGSVDYSYYDPAYPKSTEDPKNPYAGYEETDYATFSWKLRSPWRFMVGVAGVIGNSAIISVDYERQAYNDMKVKHAVYDNYGYVNDYVESDYVNSDIKNYTRGVNILRIGAEYRVTPQFSLRAGYNYQTSQIKSEAADGNLEVITSGTDPSYSLDKDTQNISFGLGYKFGPCYLDATYMHSNRKSTLHPYTNYIADGSNNLVAAPKYDVSQNNNSIVLTFGYRF